jgi:hypothetical protein
MFIIMFKHQGGGVALDSDPGAGARRRIWLPKP